MTVKPAVRAEVFARDGMKCVYCGRFVRKDYRNGWCAPDSATVDHVKPRAAGGPSNRDNLVTSCFACNQAKADHHPGEPPWEPPTLADVFGDALARRSA